MTQDNDHLRASADELKKSHTPTADAPANGSVVWCLFRSGGKPFAIPLDAVVEVISVDRLIRLPLAPPGVLGLFMLRRDLTPVIDLVEPDAKEKSKSAVIGMSVLVASNDSQYWGIVVDPGTTEVDKAPLEVNGVNDLSSVRVPGACGWRQRDGVAHLAIDPQAAWLSLRSGIKHWYTQSAAFSPTTVSEST